MPHRIIFWNIARAGGGEASEVTDNLDEDIVGLIGEYKPDAIVLCEAHQGTRKGFRAKLPPGWIAPKFVKQASAAPLAGPAPAAPNGGQASLGDYKKDTTLRYILIQRAALGCVGYLLVTGKTRPALAFRVDNKWVLALHAPSKSNTVVPQTDAIKSAYTECQLRLGAAPALLVGDININSLDAGKLGYADHRLNGNFLYQKLLPGQATHKGGSGLDWAIKFGANAGFNPALTVIEPADDGMQFDYDKDDDDYDFAPPFQNIKNSDHKPIMVSW